MRRVRRERNLKIKRVKGIEILKLKMINLRKLVSSLFGILIIFLLSHCAKERNIERYPDPNNLILSKNYFTGREKQDFWYHKTTVTHVSNTHERRSFGRKSLGFIGLQNKVKIVFFHFQDQKLHIRNALDDDSKLKVLEVNGVIVNPHIQSLDIEVVDFRLDEIDGRTTNVEEVNPYITWDDNRYFRILIGEQSKNINSFPSLKFWSPKAHRCWNPEKKYIDSQSIKVTQNHMSYTDIVEYQYQENGTTGDCPTLSISEKQILHYKHAFRRLSQKEEDLNFPPSEYTPHEYEIERNTSTGAITDIDPNYRKYGFFVTPVKSINEVGLEEYKYIRNQWPYGRHTFYFNSSLYTNDPQYSEYKKIFTDETKGIFSRINRLYEEENIPMRFEVRDNQAGEKSLGDFYPIIEVVSSKSPVLGYGPLDVDPRDGRALSGNIVISLRAINYLVQTLEDQLIRMTSENLNKEGLLKSIAKNAGLIQENEEEPIDHYDKLVEFVTESSKPLKGKEQIISQLLSKTTFAHPSHWHESEIGESDTKEQVGKLSTLLKTRSQISLKEIKESLNGLSNKINNYVKTVYEEKNWDDNKSVIYPLEESIINLGIGSSISGISGHNAIQKIIKDVIVNDAIIDRERNKIRNTIAYNLGLHETLHVLGLRHNFMGSFDKKNFRNKDTSFTSSIMDYQSLVGRAFHRDFNLGKYDEAALLHAYKPDKTHNEAHQPDEKAYLHCSDFEIFNMFCNKWDQGTTFSEIMLNLIINYNNLYYRLNKPFRINPITEKRYEKYVLNTMIQVKTFLIAITGFLPIDIREILSSSSRPNLEIESIEQAIYSDLSSANLLGVAFLSAVIQEENRPLLNAFQTSGIKKTQGIFYDKFYASIVLLGSHSWFYNPNDPISLLSYNEVFKLPFPGFEKYSSRVERILNNILVGKNVDENQLSFDNRSLTRLARILYILDSLNFVNRSESSFIQKLGVACFSSKTSFKNYFNQNQSETNLDWETLRLDWETLNRGEDSLGIVSKNKGIGGTNNKRYYVVSKIKNPFSYNIFKRGQNYPQHQDQDKVKFDLIELYNFQNLVQLSDPVSNCSQ